MLVYVYTRSLLICNVLHKVLNRGMQYSLIFANHAVCILGTVYCIILYCIILYSIIVQSLVLKKAEGTNTATQRHPKAYNFKIIYACAEDLGQDLGHAQEVSRQAL